MPINKIYNPTVGPADLAAQQVAYIQSQKGNQTETGAQAVAKVKNQGMPGYDVFGNSIQAPSSVPVSTADPKISQIYGSYKTDPALSYLNQVGQNAPTSYAVDEATIRAETMKRIQAEIDAQNKVYDQKLAEANQQGVGRIGQVSAINARRGLAGSDFGVSNVNQTQDANRRITDSIQNERQAMIASLQTQGNNDAVQQIASERQNVATQIQNQIAQLAQKQKLQNDAASNIAKMALAAGLDLSNKSNAQALADQYGLPLELLAASYLDAQSASKTASLEEELKRADLTAKNVAAEKSRYITVGDGTQLYDSESGKVVAENQKTFAPVNINMGGLSPAQINSTVNSIAGAFDNEPVVKQFQQLQDANSFAKNMPLDTKNPADDQALIYAFAKAMDPDSVVREGEYATVQKYSQNFVNTYGKSVENAINGTGFLSNEARKNIKKTIEQKFQTKQTQYNQVKNEYQRQMQDAQGGKPRILTDYTTPQPTTPAPTGVVTIQGRQVQVGSTITNSQGKKAEVQADGKLIPL